MGRTPAVPGGRTVRVPVRLSQAEAERLDGERGSLSRSDFIRLRVFANPRTDHASVQRLKAEQRGLLPAAIDPVATREEGRQLASERDDLIAAGVDPTQLAVPIDPVAARAAKIVSKVDTHEHHWVKTGDLFDGCASPACGATRPHQTGTR